MWARVCELCLGAWMIASPWIFEAGSVMDVLFGVTTVMLAAISFRKTMRRAHLGILVVAIMMIAMGYVMSTPEEANPAQQNQIATGLLLATFAIVPSQASLPPPGWREFMRKT
jgi:CDP-diglyceride synthetase